MKLICILLITLLSFIIYPSNAKSHNRANIRSLSMNELPKKKSGNYTKPIKLINPARLAIQYQALMFEIDKAVGKSPITNQIKDLFLKFYKLKEGVINIDKKKQGIKVKGKNASLFVESESENEYESENESENESEKPSSKVLKKGGGGSFCKFRMTEESKKKLAQLSKTKIKQAIELFNKYSTEKIPRTLAVKFHLLKEPLANLAGQHEKLISIFIQNLATNIHDREK